MREGLPLAALCVRLPSGTSDRRFSWSSHVSRCNTQGEVGRSGGDQHGECVLKSPPSIRGPGGRVRESKKSRFDVRF